MYYKDYEIKPITGIKKHQSNKEIEQYLTLINNELYFFANLPVNYDSKEFLKSQITDIGQKLKTLAITRESQQLDRRNEILNKLRTIYSNLTTCSSSSQNDIIKSNKYLVALYLKDKKEGMDDKQKLNWIYKIKHFARFYEVTETLANVQTELLKDFRVFPEQQNNKIK